MCSKSVVARSASDLQQDYPDNDNDLIGMLLSYNKMIEARDEIIDYKRFCSVFQCGLQLERDFDAQNAANLLVYITKARPGSAAFCYSLNVFFSTICKSLLGAQVAHFACCGFPMG